MIDTHCHLDFNSFENDRNEVIQRARQAGISKIINPGIDLQSSARAILLAETFPEVYAAVGIHPNSATSWKKGTRKELRKLAKHPKVIAIGEIGLDYYRKQAPVDLQIMVFREQLQLAAELGKPVIVHNRQSSQDVFNILSEWKDELANHHLDLTNTPGVLHSFSGDRELLEKVAKINFRIGISGPVTFKNAYELQEVVKTVPSSRIVLETDAPFLTPHPYRGERNESAYLCIIANMVAELRQVDCDQLEKETTLNAHQLFHL